MLEFRSAEEKLQAMQEVKWFALQGTNPANENAADDSEQEVKEDTIAQTEEENSSDDSDLLSPLSWCMGYRGSPL